MTDRNKNGGGDGPSTRNGRHDGHEHGDHGDTMHGAADDRANPRGLTRNESLVWGTLAEGEEPLKAYEILDQLKGKGVRAPMTVYRALEGLEEKGFIHKLEGMNSFVVCNHEGPHEVQVFLVCEKCGSAQEIHIEGVRQALAPALRRESFEMETARLEARGRCAGCIEK